MTELSRRTFLLTSGASAAALGTLSMLPGEAADAATTHSELAQRASGSREDAARRIEASSTGFVVYIPNPKNGQIHFMIGNKEIIRTDKSLVTQLLRHAD